MEYLALFVTVGIVHLLAAMSPGPDFFMVIRNTLSYSRKVGILTAVGVSMGLLVHITYSLVGIGVIISQSIIAFNILKWIGAAYLIYIGWKSITSKGTTFKKTAKKKTISNFHALRMGFLTNVLNPKATLYFLSLFTVVISPTTPFSVQLLLAPEILFIQIAWFTSLALLLSHKVFVSQFRKTQGYFEKAMGALLIGLGIKIAVSK